MLVCCFNSDKNKPTITNKIISNTNHLQNIRQENVNKLIFAHLNVNLIRNKLDSLVKDIKLIFL